MQAVLDAHAALMPKPIESLTAAEARKQPTPADAVSAVLKQQGKSTDPEKLVPGVKAQAAPAATPAAIRPEQVQC